MRFVKSILNRLNIIGPERNILDETIRKIVYVLVFLIPLWFLPSTINAVEFNKQALTVLLIVVALILWLIKILNQGEIRWRGGLLNILIAVFALVCILSTIFSIRPYGSLVGWTDHLSGSLINILCFIIFWFLILNNFRGPKDAFGLLFAFLISSALASVVGLLQLWGGFIFPWDFAKVTSFNTIGSINALGIFSVITTVISASLLFVVKRGGIKLFLVILGLLNLLILININFWMLWVLLAVGMAIILSLGLAYVVQLGENISWVGLPILLLAISLIFIFFKPALPYKTNLPVEVGLSYKGGWSVMTSALKDKPILGSGPETFVFNYVKYKPEGINPTAFWNVRFSDAPSEIMSLASDIGILGFLSFLAIVVLFTTKLILGLIKEKGDDILKKFLSIVFFAGWLTLIVAWILYPQNFVLIFLFWLLMGLSLVEDSFSKEHSYNLRKSPKVLLVTSFSFIVLIVLIIGLLYIEGIRFVAEINYKKGMDLVQTNNDIEGGVNKIIKATIINPYEDNTYQALAQLFLYKLNIDAAKEELSQQEKINLLQVDAVNAANSAAQTTRLSPKDASNWLLRGQVYRQLLTIINGASDWAESSYKEAAKLEPTNPFTYLELGRLYANKADAIVEQAKEDQEARKKWDEYMATALEYFDKAIVLKPNYAPAHFEEAMIYDRQGKTKEAIAKMEINRQLLPNDSGAAFQLGVLYYRTEQYDKAKNEFIRAIAIDDNFSNARYFLGLLYDREGNKEDAIDQFDRILQLNPDNEQVKQILENLRTGKPALGSPELGPPKQPSQIPIEEKPKAQK